MHKELVARAVHKLSDRPRDGWFAMDCGTIPPELAESELFGYKKNAFTGATTDKLGLLHAANGGTLFLDEIGKMNHRVQSKLLRFLETRRFRPVGSSEGKENEIDVRIIAAANEDLKGEISRGLFLEDLYHRFAQLEIHVPPLRERRDDIAVLAEHFLKRIGDQLSRIFWFSDYARTQLTKATWAGNVRQLMYKIERVARQQRAGEIERIVFTADDLAIHAASKGKMDPVTFLEAYTRLDGWRHLLARDFNLSERQIERHADEFGLALRDARREHPPETAT